MKNKSCITMKNSYFVFICASAIFIIFMISCGMQFLDESVKNVIGGPAWAAICFLLPVAAFILAVFLRLKLKKCVLISFMCIFLYAAIAFGTIYAVESYLSEFTTDKWEKYQTERYHMIEDMTSEINFIGKTKEEVIEILGEPNVPYADSDGVDLIDYHVGTFSIDPTMITFVFENNEVVEIYEYTEFRKAKKQLQ